ncbi:hypothetical protein [Alistipes sp. ZOR0009]|uniref:hypothetical protein n=1 Tax=Alistipes sp. ZOR0009 TaxID=1339253 RepID=UPI000648D78A|nr:hypothetical protein [Alistipes sp. ZOR0009]
MKKSIENIQVVKCLSKMEQSSILGGDTNSQYCDEENPCFMAGYCCLNNYCIPKIDKRGNYMFCDF